MTPGPLHIVHTEASAGWGGQEIRILSEATGLRDRGHQVELLTPGHAPILQAARKLDLSATALPIGKKRWPALQAMRHWLSEHPGVDVINTHSSSDSWLAALACRTLRQAPLIVRTRHISTPVSTRATTRWMYTRATRHIVTTGERLRETLIRDNGFPAEQITSVPTGQDADHYFPVASAEDKDRLRQQLGVPCNKTVIGILATLRDWKGHQDLIAAIAGLQRSDVLLLIVGDGPYRASIEASIAEHRLGDQTSMVGNQQDVTPWLQIMDLFTLPSWANEGVPQGILQAMMCGLPVLSTPIGSIEEAVVHGKTGIIVPPRDVNALRQQIAGLLDDPQRARSLGQAGHRRAMRHFSRETMLDDMEAIFRCVVDQQRRTVTPRTISRR